MPHNMGSDFFDTIQVREIVTGVLAVVLQTGDVRPAITSCAWLGVTLEAVQAAAGCAYHAPPKEIEGEVVRRDDLEELNHKDFLALRDEINRQRGL